MINVRWIIPAGKLTNIEYQMNRQIYTVVWEIVSDLNRKIESVYDDPAYWMDL